MIRSSRQLARSPIQVHLRARMFALPLLLAVAACSDAQDPSPADVPDAGLEHTSNPARQPSTPADASTPPDGGGEERRPGTRTDASAALDSDAAAGARSTRGDADASTGEPLPSAADSGGPTNVVEDEADAGDEPASCTSRTCLCTTTCERGIALGCLAEDPLEQCVALCDQMPPAACADEATRVLVCRAEQPASNYSCDLDFEAFVVDGCAFEEDALQACRIR